MQTNIQDAPHGMNLVIECSDGKIVIGRFDSSNGFEIIMHDVDLYDPASGGDSQAWVKETATYGVDVKHRDYSVDAHLVTGWTPLGKIEKLS